MSESPSIRELRWKKIENHVTKGREQLPSSLEESWLVVLPSTSQGFMNILHLPFVKDIDSIHLMFENRKDWYAEFEEKYSGDELQKILFSTLNPILSQKTEGIDFHVMADMLWFIVMFFHKKNDSNPSVEIFDDEKIVFVDFNLVQAPMPTPHISQEGLISRSVH